LVPTIKQPTSCLFFENRQICIFGKSIFRRTSWKLNSESLNPEKSTRKSISLKKSIFTFSNFQSFYFFLLKECFWFNWRIKEEEDNNEFRRKKETSFTFGNKNWLKKTFQILIVMFYFNAIVQLKETFLQNRHFNVFTTF
jgi:hypothetical protein